VLGAWTQYRTWAAPALLQVVESGTRTWGCGRVRVAVRRGMLLIMAMKDGWGGEYE
jgi:hypothetical protein